MKKRRELDALVNGKMGRKKTKKGQHELLRNDSESSEMEEFSIPQKTVVRKRQTSRICATCLMACGFFLLVACLVTVGGLVYVHISLQQNVDSLRQQLKKAGSGTNTEMTDFQSKQETLEAAIKELQTDKQGFDDISTHISDINKQINFLNVTADYLKEKIKSLEERLAKAPVLESLPSKLEVLEKSVADMGSNLATLKTSVDTLQQARTQLTSRIEALDHQDSAEKDEGGRSAAPMGPSGTGSQSTSQITDVKDFVASVKDWNKTLTAQLSHMMDNSQHHLMMIQEVDNKTMLLDNRVALLELRTMSSGITGQPLPPAQPDMEAIVQEAVTSVLEELKNFTKDQRQSVDAAAMRNITERVNQLTDLMHTLQREVDETGSADGATVASSADSSELLQRFNELKNLVEEYKTADSGRFQGINSSLWTLDNRLSSLETGMTTLSGRVADVVASIQESGPLAPSEGRSPDKTMGPTPPPSPSSSSQSQSEWSSRSSMETGGSNDGPPSAPPTWPPQDRNEKQDTSKERWEYNSDFDDDYDESGSSSAASFGRKDDSYERSEVGSGTDQAQATGDTSGVSKEGQPTTIITSTTTTSTTTTPTWNQEHSDFKDDYDESMENNGGDSGGATVTVPPDQDTTLLNQEQLLTTEKPWPFHYNFDSIEFDDRWPLRSEVVQSSKSTVMSTTTSPTTSSRTNLAVDGRGKQVSDESKESQDGSTVPLITTESIKTPQDLADKFLLWDQDGTGYVSYEDLSGFLGPHMPTRVALTQYDKDTDLRYTLEELAPAFGFSIDSLHDGGSSNKQNRGSPFLPEEDTGTQSRFFRRKRQAGKVNLNDLFNQV